MFKKNGDLNEIISNKQLTKTSVSRTFRNFIKDHYGFFSETDVLDTLLPVKKQFSLTKCHGMIELLSDENEHIFFKKTKSDMWMPSLHLLHMYPDILSYQTVDKGAIKFILGGANIMCPGLTSPGGVLQDLPLNSVVGIKAEGKEYPLAIGTMVMNFKDIKEKNQGIAIQVNHFLGDSLWNYNSQFHVS